MQRIVSISASNFMTFESIELQFDRKCYVIKGDNKDDDGQESNGSGKTSLLDIIAVALLGESLTGRDLKNCVRWNSEDPYFLVSITLEDTPHYDDPDFQVHTVISRKIYNNTRASELSILLNNQPPKGVMSKTGLVGGVDTREGNKYILETVLGISKEDLLSYFLISGDAYQPFFSVNNIKKIEIISRFSKAQKVDRVIERLNNELKLFNNTLTDYTASLSFHEGQLVSLNELVDQKAIDEFEKKKKYDLENTLADIEELEKTKDNLNYKLVVESESNKLDEKIESTEYQLDELRILGHEILKEKRQKEVEKSALNVLLAGEVECPKCSHKFTTNNPYSSLDHVRELIKGLDSEITQFINDSEEVNKSYQELEKEYGEMKNRRREIDAIEHENDLIRKREVSIMQGIADLEEKLLEIDARVFDDGGIKEKIKQIENEKAFAENSIVTTQSHIEYYSNWIDRFKQFRFYLANKPVEIICHYTNDFLKNLNSDLSISIEGFKTLKSGELKAELTPLVYRNQVNPQPYTSFSGGERVRLNLAVDLALQRLINENSNEGLEFYANDEAINSIDSLGLVQAAKAFNELNQTICLISHSGNELNYENVVTVQKKSGKSEII